MNNFTTVIAVVLGTVFIGAPALAQVTIAGSATHVTRGPDNQFSPAIDGDIVVYSSTSSTTGDTDVYFTDLLTMVETQVTSAPGAQELQDVSAGTIVYKDTAIFGGSTIYSYDVAAGTALPVTTPNGNESAPTVSGSVVVCESLGSSVDVYAFDLSTGNSTVIAATADDERLPRVDGTQLVFERSTATGWDVVVADLAGGQTVLATGLAVEPTPDLSGNTVAYVIVAAGGDLDLVTYDLTTGNTSVIAAPGDQSRPRLAGEMLAFDDASAADLDVIVRHLPSGIEHRVPGTGTFEFLNDLTANRVAYSSNAMGSFDIWVYDFTVTVPPPPTGDLCLGGGVPTQSHVFTSSASVTLSGSASGQVLLRVEGECDDASVLVDGQLWLDEEDLEHGDACWTLPVDLSGSVTLTVAMDGDDGDDSGEADHDDGDSDDHGEADHDDGDGDHGDEACTITVEAYAGSSTGASAITASASPIGAGGVSPTTPQAGCASAAGHSSFWLIAFMALGLALLGRRERVTVSARRRTRP